MEVVQEPPNDEGEPGARTDPLRGITYLTSTVPAWDVRSLWLSLPSKEDSVICLDKFNSLVCISRIF